MIENIFLKNIEILFTYQFAIHYFSQRSPAISY